MDWNGNVKTPFGEVSRKNLAIGGVIGGIFAVMWYRSYRQKQAQAASVAAAGQSEINPATGYPYGSAEDAAALAAQAGYISPGGGGGGSSGGAIPSGIVTNDQWSQEVLSLWASHDLGDPGPIAQAIGVYLAGQVPTDDQKTLITTAIALAGYPPKEGNGGYPPHINTSNTQNPDPTPTGGPKNYPAWSTSVTAGELVETFNGQVRDHFGGLVDWGIVVAANPAIESNINWDKSIDKRTFKKPASYTIPAMTR